MSDRNKLFIELERKFKSWLEQRGVGAAAQHYVANLKAIGTEIQPHNTNGGAWFGLMKLLTGKQPVVGVYEISGIEDFAKNYGAAIPFFTMDKKARNQIENLYPNCKNFDELFNFAYSDEQGRRGDGGHTRSAFLKYLQFLCEIEAQADEAQFSTAFSHSRQLITYGAPGTGKSHQTEEVVKRYADTVRTTFHPDSDYTTFVGCYKPTMEKKPKYDSQGLPIKANGAELTEEVITYAYVPQAFTKAYVRAWEKMAEPGADGKVEPQFLVIEEINRGNCAQIFGDLFQLLDRNDEGYSEYSIEVDSDLGKFIADTMAEWPAAMQARIPDEVRLGKKLVLPPNFCIWATMNTSDQSLFPIDSAFKRRWDWRYIPIRDAGMGWIIRVDVPGGEAVEYDWWAFLDKVNGLILSARGSEDKQLGYFFAKPDKDGDAIGEEKFVNKVLFYLYNDAFKDYDLPPEFVKPGGDKFAFKDFFLTDGTPDGGTVKALLDRLLKKGE